MKNRRSFIVGIKSTKLLKNEKIFLKKYKPWGIILFTRNLNNFFQIKKLISDIRLLFHDYNYPILIDQEGGRINRLSKLIEASNLTNHYFGKLYKKDRKKFYDYYKIYINQKSYILNELGININTVPVLDIRYPKRSNVIGDRSYSSSSKIVSAIGNYCINQFSNNKIGTVIKHIPGHGLSYVDSHNQIPKVKNSLKYLIKNDFSPFKKKKSLFAMTAHVIYLDIDPLNTATHSCKVINLIRKKIGFKNILISDDISMKALRYSTKTNTIKAFTSGCNLVLHCNGKLHEMRTVAENSPILSKFMIKKTSQFYNFLS